MDTVRFYERRGILPVARRRPSGYRVSDAAAVERIRMAKSLQELGFTLDEIVDALAAHDRGGATCDSERWRLEAVVNRIDAKIAELGRARRAAVETLSDFAGQGAAGWLVRTPTEIAAGSPIRMPTDVVAGSRIGRAA